jgi:hypothetical protein
VAAAYLQEPDHARARPSRYFKDPNYAKVFSTPPIDIYEFCAVLRKTTESFLTQHEPERRDRNNLLFYVMMTALCMQLQTARATVKSILELKDKNKNVSLAAMEAALRIVRPIYDQYGASDQAAKGTEMVTDLKAKMIANFGKKRLRKSH